MENKGKNYEFKIIKGAVLTILCFICLFVGTNAYATERKVVRVAFFPMDGYHMVDADGTYTGMDVEYLNAIEHYTSWDIRYVACDSWEDALKMLKKREVDLVGSAQY